MSIETLSPPAQIRSLAASAMLGTDRAGRSTPAELLTRAVVTGMQSRAGWRPGTCSGALPACPPDPRPAASTAAMSTLARLLGAPDQGLIEEWATLAQARGVRVGDSGVPLLLNWWSRQPHKSEAVFVVAGSRGEWLASLNPAWRKPVAGAAIPPNADEIWQTGRTSERLSVLATVRRDDPARAHEMIKSTWGADGADERRRFVEAMVVNLSLADEEFLEAALDDKSKLVKRAAAAVLGRLSGSRLRRRMNERTRAMIVVEKEKKGLLRKTSVKVTLNPPQEYSKEWERDGVEEAAPQGTGKRAFWMREIMSGADLSVWTEATGLDPEGVLEAIKDDDFAKQAVAALGTAARLTADAAWSLTLARAALKRKGDPGYGLAPLWNNLPDGEREAVLFEIVAHGEMPAADQWSMAATNQHPWSREFSEKILGVFKKLPPRRAMDAYAFYGAIESISRSVHPGLENEFDEAVQGLCGDVSEPMRKGVDRVRLRAQMHKELSQ